MNKHSRFFDLMAIAITAWLMISALSSASIASSSKIALVPTAVVSLGLCWQTSAVLHPLWRIVVYPGITVVMALVAAGMLAVLS